MSAALLATRITTHHVTRAHYEPELQILVLFDEASRLVALGRRADVERPPTRRLPVGQAWPRQLAHPGFSA